MHEHIVQRLALVAARLGLKTKQKLADALGIGRTTLYHIETNPETASEQFIQALEELEKQAGEQLVPTSSPARQFRSTRNADGPRMIRVISYVCAGRAENFEELPAEFMGEIPSTSRDPLALAAEVRGDSMADFYLDGDIIEMEPSTRPHSGCLVACKFREEEEMMFRKAEFYPDRVVLVPLNKSYPTFERPLADFAWIYPVTNMYRRIWKNH